MTTMHHGDNKHCPQVQSGQWTHCKGHEVPTQKPIRIVMDGGLISEVHNIPPGMTVEVYDYDVEGQDITHPNMTKDEKGKRVFVNLWGQGGQLK